MPVVGTFQAAGAVSRQLLPYFAGRVGQIANQPADELLDTADLVVTIGYDAVEYWPALWNHGRDRTLIHVDSVPAEIENDYDAAVELIGSIEETLPSLIPLLHRPSMEADSKALLARISRDREEMMAQAAAFSGAPVHPLRLIAELQDILTPDVCLAKTSYTC
jgi:acetolactate synthase I/II/III large subunit